MERGTLGESRDAYGNETIADMELLRLAMPRRVFTLSQIDYAIDRVTWPVSYTHLDVYKRQLFASPIYRVIMKEGIPV